MEILQAENPQKASNFKLLLNRLKTYLSKPENIILLVFGVVLTLMVIAPIFSIIKDSFTIHGGVEAVLSGKKAGDLGTVTWSLAIIGSYNGKLSAAHINTIWLWYPLARSLLMGVLAVVFALIFGGLAAFLVTRTNMPCKKWISTVFIFPYIMPQWTLAMIWKDLFWNVENGAGTNGLFAKAGIMFPKWWCMGLFPCSIVLGIHYAAFAYIMIGGVFRNMDSNLEEAATILNTPKWKIFFRVTLPMITPAILSTTLLIFSNAIGSYPVPHYLKYENLAVKYVEGSAAYPALPSIIALFMIVIGLAILLVNIISSSGRKQYTTVSGKAGQVEKTNLHFMKWPIAIIMIIVTLVTSVYPIISFALQSFMMNPGDYSQFTTMWWTEKTASNASMYGNVGILYNKEIRSAFGNSALVAFLCSIIAGTIGLLIGYAVSKKKHSKWAQYVNGISFLPYLLPSLGVGAAFFILGSKVGLYPTLTLVVIVGVVKYIPFASRASLNAMTQLSGEIEEAAVIQNIPWWKRMGRIIVPIQKSAFISGYMLPFITCIRELTLFMMLTSQGKLLTTLMDYFDEMNLPAFSSAINLIIIIFVLAVNLLLNKLTGASLDSGIGGGNSKN